MNKKLLTQIKNEWRSNLWLVTELLLVSIICMLRQLFTMSHVVLISPIVI